MRRLTRVMETREGEFVPGGSRRPAAKRAKAAAWSCGRGWVLAVAALAVTAGPTVKAQSGGAAPHTPVEVAPSAASARRTRLILKDGSYQVVVGYRVDGSNVRYRSAERGGVEEVIPLALVDLEATQQWEQRHLPRDPDAPPQAPVIDPELAKEEADRAALTPEVAPDLRLPEQDSVLALDTFQGTPELVPVVQSAGELNRSTAHNVLKQLINPMASPHPVVTLRGERAAVQLHVAEPEFYLRIGDETSTPASGTALTVDTHGATGNAPSAEVGGAATSQYVIVRTDVRQDARLLASFDLTGGRRQEDVVETTKTLLPGGHWMKVVSQQRLLFGEYALVEVLNDREINRGVWDFGVHPVAPENRDVIKPQARRSGELDRRSQRP